MKSLIVFLCSFLTVQIVHSQSNKETLLQLSNDSTSFYCNTRDKIYINNKKFYCNISPLSMFDNYSNIYPEIPSDEIFFTDMSVNDKNYDAVWIIKDSVLFLCDVILDYELKLDKTFYNNRHKAIENLTMRKFKQQKAQHNNSYRINENGLMTADWYSGVLYIKEYKILGSTATMEDVIKYYDKDPFYKLQFEKGKIVKIEKVYRMEPN